MAKKIESITELFEHSGGSIEIARFLKIHQNNVERWKKWGIPYRHFDSLISRFKVDVSTLHAINKTIHAKRRAADGARA